MNRTIVSCNSAFEDGIFNTHIRQGIACDILNRLEQCRVKQLVWIALAAELGQSLSVEASFKEHYERWMTKSWKRGLSKKIWMVTFFAVTWNIWLTRNEIIFHNKVFNHEVICCLLYTSDAADE